MRLEGNELGNVTEIRRDLRSQSIARLSAENQKQTATQKMKTRFVITKIDKDGLRTLASSNQGRNHFDSRENAESRLSAILSNNSESTLKSVFGDISKMKVIPTECYDHGDSVRTVFGPEA